MGSAHSIAALHPGHVTACKPYQIGRLQITVRSLSLRFAKAIHFKHTSGVSSQLSWFAGEHDYMGFMSRAWFSIRNAGALRGFLRSIILEQFAEQVRPSFAVTLATPSGWRRPCRVSARLHS